MYALRKPLTWLCACLLLAGCNLRTATGTLPLPTSAPVGGITPIAESLAEAAQPEVSETAEAVPVQAEEQDANRSSGEAELKPARCFDLDGGADRPRESADCDFTFSSLEDGSLHFEPGAYSSFSFGAVFWEPPTLDTCRNSTAYSPGSLTIAGAQGYYVCYQTGEGYWGWLQLRSYDPEGLSLAWVTFDEQAPLLVDVPAEQPVGGEEDVYTQGINRWVRIEQGLDLDTGLQQNRLEEGHDLLVATAGFDPSGVVQGLLIKPVGGAGFSFSAPLDTPPTREDCAAMAAYSPAVVPVDMLRRYFCYQTSRGRLGYLYLHEANPGIGLRLDWTTWTHIESSLVSGGSPKQGAPGEFRAEYAAPEGMWEIPVVDPVRSFSYTFHLANTGERTWSSNFRLVFVDGGLMGAPESQPIRITTDPGEQLKITLNLVAPKEFGTYTGLYWLEDPQGLRFGLGEAGDLPLQVLVNVGQPGVTLAEGSGVTLAAGYCYDLDLGYFSQEDPACDFFLLEAVDPSLITFDSPDASFDFEGLLTAPPRLGQCQAARLLRGERLLGIRSWYVCYQTDQGRYGWLHLREVGEGLLKFDWKTYE